MPKSLLDKISVCYSNSIISVGWKNGRFGKIVDIKGDRNYRFVDYIIDENWTPSKKYSSKEEEILCPVIATGIIGFWLHHKDNKRTKELFDSYFNLKCSQYEEQHKGDFDAWSRDLKKEFILPKHIPSERDAIKTSESIFEYITEDDVETINQ